MLITHNETAVKRKYFFKFYHKLNGFIIDYGRSSYSRGPFSRGSFHDLTNKLTKQFPEANINWLGNNLIIRFKDEGAKAFFLLASSHGIDI